ncbi:hypothetical protein PRK78_005903 [Emydomyces testavorans]|uniref:Btz domain-containing protein n=1 Tax=Emydomyces testavorans TaxID=2070801 RepID=A0AAF0IL49_9EURO|nr:hypothetical protein PRK78_005903 [Emydomyces testavorans]
MPPHHRRRLAASRRRFEDEGEEDGSVAGDPEDDSLSEASSYQDEDADGEGSDFSDNDLPTSLEAGKEGHAEARAQKEAKSSFPTKTQFEIKVSETEAMVNGMKLADDGAGATEIHFDDMAAENDATLGLNDKGGPTSRGQRRRREREDPGKEKEGNPAFVPTRGGFFFHDKRGGNSSNGYRGANNKSKSKPHGLIVDSNLRRPPPKPDVMDGPWAHDLHESINQGPPPSSRPSSPGPSNIPSAQSSRPVPTAPRSTPPNRSFSSTVLVGNVPVVVFLPGMANPIPYAAVPKKQHTRLPQHRPPLRRDKPVRIALPGSPPRYIFPSTERSFIFIPRALRPNQQAYRGRGRGGFYSSRRNSLYGGTAYTPSIAMSRRSSIGRVASRNGMISPGGSVMSRPPMAPGEAGKPVVRLPPMARVPLPAGSMAPPPMPPAVAPAAGAAPQTASQPPPYTPQHPPFRENRPTPTIPMHQPRPQKTVSVADIESPMRFYNPPPQQQEQPFHHQVPMALNGSSYGPETAGYSSHLRHVSHPPQVSATPLSQIPERAIHAAPFQPYPYPQPQSYYGPASYPSGPVMYPGANPEFSQYNAPVPPGPAPVFVPAGQQIPYAMPPRPTAEQTAQPGTVAHESNGTVYYYDASQFPSYPNATYPVPPQGGVVGMGGMMTPPGTYYYPQPPNGTVYYS